MSKFKLICVCMLCVIAAPILCLFMIGQALIGSPDRAMSMVVAFDECGNALFGGDPQETISRRTGLALLSGKRWAKVVAPIIDFIFGKGHCLANAKK